MSLAFGASAFSFSRLSAQSSLSQFSVDTGDVEDVVAAAESLVVDRESAVDAVVVVVLERDIADSVGAVSALALSSASSHTLFHPQA